MKTREIFKTQLSQLYSPKQELTYLLITHDGYTQVRAISFWAIGKLNQDYLYLPKDQEKNLLPVFREKPLKKAKP